MTKWNQVISREFRLLDEEIVKRTRSREKELNGVIDYILSPGGKRIRPAILILSYLASHGNDVRKVIPLAAAIELIHSATLVHDDINDAGVMRRGKKATHLKYGVSKAIIAGDYLFVKAFEIASEYPAIIMKLTADICSRLAEGEFIQERHLRNFHTTEEEYFEIIEKKTALPLSLAARVGSLMADGQYEESLARFGYNVGIAFQIIDDILDITGDPSSVRKSTAVDIRQGSPNIVIIYALGSPDRKRLLTLLSRNPEPEHVRRYIQGTDAIEYAKKKAITYVNKAKGSLIDMEKGKYSDALVDLADYVVERSC